MLIERELSCLLVVDVQARLAPAMAATRQVIDNVGILLAAAQRLDVPILASEQYRRGLGPTVPEVAKHLPDGAVVEKLHFSCLGDENFALRFRSINRPQAVVAGIEAHICVLQTAEQLLDGGKDVFVVADATSARTPANHAAALERMRAAGARIVTTEMVVFEWLEKAGTPEFKELSGLIK
jgi:nicotinamidase-related amidase